MTAPDPRLEEIESRLSKATPGPWVVRSTRATEWAPYYGVTAAENKHRYIVPAAVDWEGFGHGAKEADAEFIAHSPADVAYLLAELRKAQDKLARVEGLVSELAAESLASRNVAREIRKEPITNITRQEIRDHEQAATIATNHATRIWTAVADATGGGE